MIHISDNRTTIIVHPLQCERIEASIKLAVVKTERIELHLFYTLCGHEPALEVIALQLSYK